MSDDNKQYVVSRDNHRDLRFEGRVIAQTSTKTCNGPRQNCFHRLTVFKTKLGKYVCQNEYVTYWQGEDGASEAAVCRTVQDVIAFFGFSDAAKELYREAGFDIAQYTEQVG